MNELLAKSKTGGYLSLSDHTHQVTEAIKCFGLNFGFDAEIAREGAILHDLGKAHPSFQAMLIASPRGARKEWIGRLAGGAAVALELKTSDTYVGLEDPRVPLRHELVSLCFLPLFNESKWASLVELVVAHHKSVRGDRSERGLLDMVGRRFTQRELLDRYLMYWDTWSPAAIALAVEMGIPDRKISAGEAAKAFGTAIAIVKRILKQKGASRYRGLLMAADHFASGYQHSTKDELRQLFGRPDLSAFEARATSAKAWLYPLSQKPVADPKQHTLVTAPTGAGKTDFLIRRCTGGRRIFYTLPFQASINAMWERLRKDMPKALITRLHSASAVPLGEDAHAGQAEDADLQRHPGSAVKVLTPHQLGSLVFALPGHEAVALDVSGQHVILDEVHTYNGPSRAMVVRLVACLRELGCSVHVGTATLPRSLAERLTHVLGGPDAVYAVSLQGKALDDFDRHIVHRTQDGDGIDEDTARALVESAATSGEKVLFVGNRVALAQERFEYLQNAQLGVPVMLIHSRYRRKDRAALERQVMAFNKRNGGCVCVATQVVEVSLDISFDRLVTDAAPLDSLIQRFGRINRKRSAETLGRYKPVHVLAPASTAREVKPYELALVQASYEALPDGEVLRERFVERLMEEVYGEVDIASIEAHLKVDEAGILHQAKLTNAMRSVIVEALEISGDTAIVVSDQKAYERGDFTERPRYEIPVSSSGKYRYGHLERSEYGSRPIVIPEDWYDFRRALGAENHHALLGVGMRESNQAMFY